MPDNVSDTANGGERESGFVHLSYARKSVQMNNLRQTAWELKSAAVKLAHPERTDVQITARVREIFRMQPRDLIDIL